MFEYALSNPMLYVDPSGLTISQDIAFVGMVIAAVGAIISSGGTVTAGAITAAAGASGSFYGRHKKGIDNAFKDYFDYHNPRRRPNPVPKPFYCNCCKRTYPHAHIYVNRFPRG